jgi:alkaline phosphatase
MKKSGLDRREFIQAATGIAAVPAVLAATHPGQAARSERVSVPGKRPKNIIFMVSDGMSMGVLSLAEPLSQQMRGKGTHWHALMQRRDVAHGWFDMASLNSLVTDSAAASSAWGSGSRVFNAAINVLPDGTKLTPICTLARQAGRRTGLVTTATVTHATPAGFAASVPKRDDEETIAVQYLDAVDVILGGGTKFFVADKRSDKRDLLGEFSKAGYATVQTRNELLKTDAAATARMIGLFSNGHIPYTIDRDNKPEIAAAVPTLAEMAKAALDSLAASPKGFLLQIEGARIDHAAHANDAAGALLDQVAFDDAIGVALEFAAKHPDTLIVVTSDHGNSNPGLNGMKEEYTASNECFAKVAGFKASFSEIESRMRAAAKDSAPLEAAAAAAILKETTGIEIEAGEADAIAQAVNGNPPATLNKQLGKFSGTLGQVLSNHIGIGWTGNTHTADYTVLTALGPGQELFAGLHLNTDAFHAMCALMGIEHENPSMKPEEARKAAYVPPQVSPVHWA